MQIAQTGSDKQTDGMQALSTPSPVKDAKKQEVEKELKNGSSVDPGDGGAGVGLASVAESIESKDSEPKAPVTSSPQALPRLSVEIPQTGVSLSNEEATTGARLETEEAMRIAARAAGVLTASVEPSGHVSPTLDEKESFTGKSKSSSSGSGSEEGEEDTRDIPDPIEVDTMSRVTSASSAKITRQHPKREISDYLPSRKKHDSRRRFKQVARTNLEDLKKEWMNDPVMKNLESNLPNASKEVSVMNNEAVGRSLAHVKRGSQTMARRTSSELLTDVAEAKGPRRMSVARRQSAIRPLPHRQDPQPHSMPAHDLGVNESGVVLQNPSTRNTTDMMRRSSAVDTGAMSSYAGKEQRIAAKPTISALESWKHAPKRDGKISSAWLNDAKDDALRAGSDRALTPSPVPSPQPSPSPLLVKGSALTKEERSLLEREIKELERDLKTMARQNKALSRNNEMMTETIQHLEQKLQSETERADKAEECITSVDRVKQQQAAIRIRNKEAQLEKERKELEKLRADLDARQLELNEEEDRISRLLPNPETFDCSVDEVDRMIIEAGRRRNDEIVDMVEHIRQQREEGTWVDLMIKSRLNRSLQDTTKATAAFNLAGTEGRSRRGGDGISSESSSVLGSAAGYSVRHRLSKMYDAYRNEAVRANSRKRAERAGDSTNLSLRPNNTNVSDFYANALKGSRSHESAQPRNHNELEDDMGAVRHSRGTGSGNLEVETASNDLKTKFINEFGMYFSDEEM